MCLLKRQKANYKIGTRKDANTETHTYTEAHTCTLKHTHTQRQNNASCVI